MRHAGANIASRAADTHHVQARGAAVRSLHERGLTWVSLDPIRDLACGANIAMRQLPGLGLQTGTVWGNRHRHTEENVAQGIDDFSIHTNLSGLSVVAGRGREITLRDGDAVLFSYAETRTVTRPGPVRHCIVRLPRADLSPLVPSIDDAVMKAIPSGTGVLSLLANYANALINDPAVTSPQVRRLVTAQLCDLIAVTLGATNDAAAAAEGRGIRVARLRAIKDDIEAHLTDSDLTSAGV